MLATLKTLVLALNANAVAVDLLLGVALDPRVETMTGYRVVVEVSSIDRIAFEGPIRP
jgi:hypothetical protein